MNRLSPTWNKYLSERGVSEAALSARGYREVHSGKALGEEFAATYHFPQKAGGLLIPLHPLLGGDPAYQLRYPPGQEPVKDGKVQKIHHASKVETAAMPVDFPSHSGSSSSGHTGDIHS